MKAASPRRSLSLSHTRPCARTRTHTHAKSRASVALARRLQLDTREGSAHTRARTPLCEICRTELVITRRAKMIDKAAGLVSIYTYYPCRCTFFSAERERGPAPLCVYLLPAKRNGQGGLCRGGDFFAILRAASRGWTTRVCACACFFFFKPFGGVIRV